MPSPIVEPAPLDQPMPAPGALVIRNALLIALACWLFGVASFETGAGHGFDKLIWLPSGIGLAAMLALGWRYWPAVALGGAALGISHGLGMAGALVLGAAGVVEALVGAYLLRRAGFDRRCERLRDVLALVLVAFGAAVPASALEYLALVPGAPGDVGAIVWWACFIGRALGALLIVPLALANTRALRSVAGGLRLFELLVLVAGTGGLSLAVFASMGDPDMFNPLPYALFPLLFWGALRFGPREVSALLLLAGFIAVWGTAGGDGPFAMSTREAALGALYLYLSVVSIVALALAAAISERRRSEEMLSWIAHATAPFTDESFFRELIRHMAGAFGFKVVLISECADFPVTRVRTLACWHENDFAPNAEYELADTPCAQVVATGKPVCVPDRVGELYARERGLGVQGYLGVPMMDSSNERVIGHLAFLSDGPMDEAVLQSPLFQILSSRAGAELRRKRAEEQGRHHMQQLAQVSRALALGEMGSAIAHELNQPLAAIASYSQACRRLMQAGESGAEVQRAMERIGVQAERAGEILRRLRGFLAQSDTVVTRLDLDTLVAEVIDLARPEARQRAVSLVPELAGKLPPVSIDGIQIQQVVLNLIRNAIEAVAEHDGPVRSVSVATSVSDGEVCVAVSDSGPGIAPELVERIFEPFFTTKRSGTGIGLAISTSIAEAHGGRLRFEPRPDGGARFVLYLPQSRSAHD